MQEIHEPPRILPEITVLATVRQGRGMQQYAGAAICKGINQ